MKNSALLLFLILFTTNVGNAQNDFSSYFEKRTLRIDFSLTGNDSIQQAAVQQLREEPVWGGPVKNMEDPFGYGGYYINVYDLASGKKIYSRGFNTLFEEWRTTDQAKVETQSWNNSVSVPFPKKPIRIELCARDKSDMEFHPIMTQTIDPKSIFIDRSPLKKNKIVKIQDKGDSAEKVDLVFLAEGYTMEELEKFESDARRFTKTLFDTPPFGKFKSDFNVWAVCIPSEESGMDVSGDSIWKNTALNSGYYTFGIDRYLTSQDMKPIRDAVWNVPCDAIFILVYSDTYGGGGMYNFYAMSTAHNELTSVVFVHEFGHSFAGLADEYFDSEVAYNDFYNLKYEPWEPNITTLVNFESKWKDLLPKKTPVPTPLNETFKEQIGVFEGGGYLSKGIYRPMNNCMMRNYHPFCPACQRGITQMINFLTDRPVK